MINLLRRTAAIVGVLVLFPLALNMATGNLSPKDAGIRAAITFGAVIAARRMIGYLRFLEELPAGAGR